MTLQGKVAIVTGGASGIGRASAIKLAAAGAQVIVSDLNQQGGQETIAMIHDAGGEAIFTRCDVTKAHDVQAMVDLAVQTYGRLDIALNNAGVGGMMQAVHEVDESTWDFVMNVNLKGVWLCMKYQIPQMLASEGGSIINVASLAGLVGFRGNAPYSASKFAVIGLTKSAALEYATKGIRVNAICPGFVETPMVTTMVEEVPQMQSTVQRSAPMRRLGRPEEIADMVVFLADDTASFITGQAIALDGGASAQ
ncbi:MAG: short chain dehydrogenase [Phototrophicales bacterium]|nr:MAG: short chain dehydrogenase [Phototrophicales bacterium]